LNVLIMFKVKRRRSKSNSKGSSNNSGGNGSASGGGSASGSATSGGGIGIGYSNSSVSSSRPGSDGSSNQSHASKLKSCLRRPSSSDNSFPGGGSAGAIAGIANFIAGGSSEDCSGSYRSQGNNSASAASSAQSSGGDASDGTFSHQSQQSFPQQQQKANVAAAANGNIATPSWNIPAGNAMATTPSIMSNKKGRRSVGFQTVQVREYERVIGDNPSCSNGAPISIGWRHVSEHSHTMDEYERKRAPYRRTQHDLVLTRQEREEKLIEWNHTFPEIIESIRANVRAKHQRRRTVNSIGTYDRWEEAMENASRRLKRTLLLQRRSRDPRIRQLEELTTQAERLAAAKQQALLQKAHDLNAGAIPTPTPHQQAQHHMSNLAHLPHPHHRPITVVETMPMRPVRIPSPSQSPIHSHKDRVADIPSAQQLDNELQHSTLTRSSFQVEEPQKQQAEQQLRPQDNMLPTRKQVQPDRKPEDYDDLARDGQVDHDIDEGLSKSAIDMSSPPAPILEIDFVEDDYRDLLSSQRSADDGMDDFDDYDEDDFGDLVSNSERYHQQYPDQPIISIDTSALGEPIVDPNLGILYPIPMNALPPGYSFNHIQPMPFAVEYSRPSSAAAMNGAGGERNDYTMGQMGNHHAAFNDYSGLSPYSSYTLPTPPDYSQTWQFQQLAAPALIPHGINNPNIATSDAAEAPLEGGPGVRRTATTPVIISEDGQFDYNIDDEDQEWENGFTMQPPPHSNSIISKWE